MFDINDFECCYNNNCAFGCDYFNVRSIHNKIDLLVKNDIYYHVNDNDYEYYDNILCKQFAMKIVMQEISLADIKRVHKWFKKYHTSVWGTYVESDECVNLFYDTEFYNIVVYSNSESDLVKFKLSWNSSDVRV